MKYMNITIILPWYNNNLPSGGVLNIYGYVERLAKRGYKINLIYDCYKGKGKLKIPNPIAFNYRKKNTISKVGLCNIENVQEIPVYSVNDDTVPDADFVVATALVTVAVVKRLSKNKGKKIYFIQGFENWGTSKEKVYKTYAQDMINITVSKWLFDLVKTHAVSATYYLPNAVEDCFFCDKVIEKRKPDTIGFMYVPIKAKGTYDVLKAIESIHRKYPKIKFEAFGIYSQCDDLPAYVKYTYNPTRSQLCKLYNRCSIFVCASWIEGFGLTAAESMKCGCCLVTTNSKGILDFSVDGKTALICNPRDINGLTEKIEYAINNVDLRIEIAKAGEKVIQNFNWKNNIIQLERILLDNIKNEEKTFV